MLLLLPLALIGCSKPTATSDAPPALSAEVAQAALERGKAISAEAFGLLSSNLQTAMQSGGVSNALPFCSLVASPLTRGMAEKHGVHLRRVTHKARNPTAKADATETEVLKCFDAALAAGANPPPLVTNLVPGRATFFAPIVLNNDLCLKCHGQPDVDLAPESLAVIRQLYPHDEATGFRLGQLRGAWRIDFALAALAPAVTPERN